VTVTPGYKTLGHCTLLLHWNENVFFPVLGDGYTQHGLDDWGSRVLCPVGLRIFLFTTESRTALEPTQPPIQWVPGAFSLGVKRQGCEADHPPHLVSRLKNAWSYTSTPQYAFMAWCLVKHRDNFTFPLTFLV
jgi:hypothetical protein